MYIQIKEGNTTVKHTVIVTHSQAHSDCNSGSQTLHFHTTNQCRKKINARRIVLFACVCVYFE